MTFLDTGISASSDDDDLLPGPAEQESRWGGLDDWLRPTEVPSTGRWEGLDEWLSPAAEQPEFEEPPERREAQAIEQARIDELFQRAREAEIATGEITQAPLRRFNQIRREFQLSPAETLPPEIIADTSDRGINAAKQALTGFTETVNRAVEGVGDLADAITELVGIDFEPPSEFFESARNVVRAFLPDDPRLREEFLSSQLPAGLGSTAGFFAGAAAGPVGLIATGVSVGAQEQAERAREAGVTGRTKALATALGGALGLTETALPLRMLKVFKPVDRAVKGKLFSAILTRGGLPADVAIEAAQEIGQQAGSNIIAKYVLKQDQDLTEGLIESGKVGGGVGLIYGALFRLAGIKARRFKSPEAQKGAEQGAKVVEEAKETILPTPPPVPREAKQAALLKDHDERVAAGQKDPTPNQGAFTEAGYEQMSRRERAAEIERLQQAPAEAVERARAATQQMGTATEAQAARVVAGEATIEQVLQESAVDPPGVSPDQTEVMGMPGSISPPPGAPSAPQGDMPVRLERPAGAQATVSAPEVIDALAAIPVALGRDVPIRVGRLRGRRRGEFKIQPEVVRIKVANDIRSASHEVGHAVDHLTVKGRFDNELAGELKALGKTLYGDKVPAGGLKREGFAEFVFLWITQPQKAKTSAPKTFRWFETEFLPEHPGAQAAFRRARQVALTWAEQGALARVEQSIVDVGSLREQLRGVRRKAKEATSIKTHIETLQPLNLFAREFEARTGRKLSTAENPFTYAQSVRLAHDARLAYMVEHGMVDSAGNRVGGSLNEAFAPVRDQWQKFVVYLYAKRAQALWNDPNFAEQGGRNPGISLVDADQVVRDLGNPDFELAAQKVYDWNDGILNYAAELSPTFALAAARIKSEDPGYYVPLQREMDGLDTFSGGQASVTAGTLTKRLRGSGRRVQHPVTRMVANAERVLLAAHRRYIMDQVIRLSKSAGMGHLVEQVPRNIIPALQRDIADVIRSVNAKLTEDQRLPIPDAVAETVTFFAPETRAPNGEPIIPYKNGDNLEFYQIDPDLLEATMGLEHHSLRNVPVFGAIMEWVFAKPRRIFVTGTTGLRMSFGLVTNPQRDPQTLYVNSRANANGMQMAYSWFRSMFSVFDPRGAKADPYFDAYLRLGTQSGQVLAQDIKRARRAARRVSQTPVRRIFDVRTPFEAIQGLIQRVETAPRLAELRRIADDVNWQPGTPMSLDQATEMLLAAKQVTTDFSASGTFSRAANQMIPFYNAAIQGPRANLRALRRNPRKMVTRGLLGLTIPTLLQWWWHKDEEWYKELPWREKYLFWYIPVGEDTLLRIPRAFEIGLIFGSMPEAFVDAWYREDSEAATEWFKTAFATLIPDLLPVLPREALAQASNWDRFWERPVVSRRLIDKPPEEQFTPFTSRAAIFLGDMFNISPSRIDHAIRGVGGGVPMDLIQTLGLGPSGVDRESEAADLPIIGRMFRRGGKLGARALSIDKVYDALDDAYTIQASDRIEESRKQRAQRLMFEDAARTISNLMVVRSLEGSTDRRNKLFKEALAIAHEALAATKLDWPVSGRFQGRRNITERTRKTALQTFDESQQTP